MGFIEWCNINQGFIMGLFSFFSLIISVIAIWISISVSKLPYKRAIRITSGTYLGNIGISPLEDSGIYVNALNVGNVPIKIVDVGLLYREEKCLEANSIFETRRIINNMEDVEVYFSQKDLEKYFVGKKGSGTVRKLEKRGVLMEKIVENIKFSVFTSSYF